MTDGRTPRQRRAEWRQAEKGRRKEARNSVRYPIITRSILLWWMIFAVAGLAFGATGAFWWANFDSQVTELRRDTEGFEQQSAEAQGQLQAVREEALADIDAALAPLRGFLSEAQMLQLAELYSPAVYTVATLDEAGAPSVGTGFAVITDEAETFLVTSYATISAATVQPGPGITLRKGTEEVPAELWRWDAPRDLALLRAGIGGMEVLPWGPVGAEGEGLGTTVFPVSGLGGSGAALTTGSVIDRSAAGIQHTAPVGAAFRGGPIVNVEGQVVAVASLDYEPLGFDPGPQIHFAPLVADVCQALITCTGEDVRAAGERG